MMPSFNVINIFIDEKYFIVEDFVDGCIDADETSEEFYKEKLFSLPVIKTVKDLSKHSVEFSFTQNTISNHLLCWENFINGESEILFCMNQDVTTDDDFDLESFFKEFAQYDLVYTSDLSLYIMKQSFCKFIMEKNKQINKIKDLFDECYQENKFSTVKRIEV